MKTKIPKMQVTPVHVTEKERKALTGVEAIRRVFSFLPTAKQAG
jgi:hypothetical protein